MARALSGVQLIGIFSYFSIFLVVRQYKMANVRASSNKNRFYLGIFFESAIIAVLTYYALGFLLGYFGTIPTPI